MAKTKKTVKTPAVAPKPEQRERLVSIRFCDPIALPGKTDATTKTYSPSSADALSAHVQVNQVVIANVKTHAAVIIPMTNVLQINMVVEGGKDDE